TNRSPTSLFRPAPNMRLASGNTWSGILSTSSMTDSRSPRSPLFLSLLAMSYPFVLTEREHLSVPSDDLDLGNRQCLLTGSDDRQQSRRHLHGSASGSDPSCETQMRLKPLFDLHRPLHVGPFSHPIRRGHGSKDSRIQPP